MTKAELIRYLDPFSDDIEIGVLSVNPSIFHTVERAKYGQDGEFDGVVLLVPNPNQIMLRRDSSR